jgi:hypothetical protein
MGLLCIRNSSVASEDTATGLPIEGRTSTCVARLRKLALIVAGTCEWVVEAASSALSVGHREAAARDGFRERSFTGDGRDRISAASGDLTQARQISAALPVAEDHVLALKPSLRESLREPLTRLTN